LSKAANSWNNHRSLLVNFILYKAAKLGFLVFDTVEKTKNSSGVISIDNVIINISLSDRTNGNMPRSAAKAVRINPNSPSWAKPSVNNQRSRSPMLKTLLII